MAKHNVSTKSARVSRTKTRNNPDAPRKPGAAWVRSWLRCSPSWVYALARAVGEETIDGHSPAVIIREGITIYRVADMRIVVDRPAGFPDSKTGEMVEIGCNVWVLLNRTDGTLTVHHIGEIFEGHFVSKLRQWAIKRRHRWTAAGLANLNASMRQRFRFAVLGPKGVEQPVQPAKGRAA